MNFVLSFVCLAICFPHSFRSKIYKKQGNSSRKHMYIHFFICNCLNIILNNRSLPLWPTEKAHIAEYRLHTGWLQALASASLSPLLSSLAPPYPAMLHNQLRCIALSNEASSSKHRQSPVSCASMDQSPLGNPNRLTQKGWKLCGQASFSTKRQKLR